MDRLKRTGSLTFWCPSFSSGLSFPAGCSGLHSWEPGRGPGPEVPGLGCIQHHLERYLPRTQRPAYWGVERAPSCGQRAGRCRPAGLAFSSPWGGADGGWWSPSSEEEHATWRSGNASRVIFWLLKPNLWTARSDQSSLKGNQP